MIKTLVRHGNSLALIIDRSILELLNIDENTPLDITTDGRRLIITPIHAGHPKKIKRDNPKRRTTTND